MTEEQDLPTPPEETEIPEKIPATKEPAEPVLEQAFKREPRHADEDPEDPA